ncbi:cutinase family protein [Nocardia asteroides]|uniref:cutinase family protein n=1 Tax=Nocardia asteroides TaxID=1824 RepID=UPI0037C7F54B
MRTNLHTMAITLAAGSVIALAAVTTVPAIGDAAAAEAGPDCPSVHVIAIPGTWETGETRHTTGPGMLAGVTDNLPASEQVTYVEYPATVFPWEGKVYGASQKVAVDSARELVRTMADRCTDTRFALLGYSQGADAAGDLAAEIGTGRGVVAPDRLAAVGLLSDPQRSPHDTQVGPPAGGVGVRGSRPGGFGSIASRIRTICAIGDLYCSTDDEDFITVVASELAAVSGGTPEDLPRYRTSAAELLAALDRAMNEVG